MRLRYGDSSIDRPKDGDYFLAWMPISRRFHDSNRKGEGRKMRKKSVFIRDTRIEVDVPEETD